MFALNIFSLIFMCFLVTGTFAPNPLTQAVGSELSGKSQRSSISCSTVADCPDPNSRCYQSRCICPFGYFWLNGYCVVYPCVNDLMCSVFPNTKCLNSTCVCRDQYEVDRDSQTCEEKGLAVGWIVAIVVGVVLLVVLVAVLIGCFVCRGRTNSRNRNPER